MENTHAHSARDHSLNTIVQFTDTSPDEPLIAGAVAACLVAKTQSVRSKELAEQQLRAIREAGRLLSLVQRSSGGRPLNNSSRRLTSYQAALERAGISRQTAHVWRKVADLDDAVFDGFIESSRHVLGALTLSRLLRVPRQPRSRVRTVKFAFSDRQYQTFTRWLETLGDAYFTSTPSETLMLILQRQYNEWLAAQTRTTTVG